MNCNATATRYPDHPESNVKYHYGRGKLACTMPSAANRRVELNAKELDEETGMYYYGARYYEPRLGLWISTDPLERKYYNSSSYAYYNNPIRFIILDGKDGRDKVKKVDYNGSQIWSNRSMNKNKR